MLSRTLSSPLGDTYRARVFQGGDRQSAPHFWRLHRNQQCWGSLKNSKFPLSPSSFLSNLSRVCWSLSRGLFSYHRVGKIIDEFYSKPCYGNFLEVHTVLCFRFPFLNRHTISVRQVLHPPWFFSTVANSLPCAVMTCLTLSLHIRGNTELFEKLG